MPDTIPTSCTNNKQNTYRIRKEGTTSRKEKLKCKGNSLDSILPTVGKKEQARSVLPVSEANIYTSCCTKQKHCLNIKKNSSQHTYHFIHRKDRLKTEEKSSTIREMDNRNFKKMQQHKLLIPKGLHQQIVHFIRYKEQAHCHNSI